MINQVSHQLTAGTAATGPASLDLALGVAYALHPPTNRAPEIATVKRAAAGRRTTARSRRTARG
ncbi:hypothetical protein PV396_25985 [Streptomyces sp. ME02-8801-2C]|uniref:hypothetical protein n=1 Tax=Streptomyces sp. ME02-8801-2C TaxID=3028680 RepID=UPI0029AEE1A7|nr:hypothetical protein [Streptomyces sp. ME02-8801-2C]MDX3455346.1 hypothetical protein [Streptomyces sp. ME02-8801-2C]